MKKITSLLLLITFLLGGFFICLQAQNGADSQTLVTAEDVRLASDASWHNAIKAYFIEGNVYFMSVIAIVFIIGLAFCLERIIYLNLSEIDTRKFIHSVSESMSKNDLNKVLSTCKNTRGPIAAIYYEGLSRIDEGIDIVEKSAISAGSTQTGWLEKGLSWITLFISIAPALGFLGTVIGMIQAFDDIQTAEAINASVIAQGMKIALITTVGGLIVAIILQLFYNYILSKIESILNKMEDATLSLLDIAVRYQINKDK